MAMSDTRRNTCPDCGGDKMGWPVGCSSCGTTRRNTEHRASVGAVNVAASIEWVVTCTCGHRSAPYRVRSNAAMDADLHEQRAIDQPLPAAEEQP